MGQYMTFGDIYHFSRALTVLFFETAGECLGIFVAEPFSRFLH